MNSNLKIKIILTKFWTILTANYKQYPKYYNQTIANRFENVPYQADGSYKGTPQFTEYIIKKGIC